MKLENNTLWNEAARSGLLFGLFSSLCLGAKEAAALSGSTFLIQAAGILLWAVEFFGCILLMKRCMLSLRDRLGAGMEDCYRLGKRIALLSGLILASVEALIILKMPQESLSGLLESAAAQLGGGHGLSSDRHLFCPVDLLLFVWNPSFVHPLPLHFPAEVSSRTGRRC